MGCNGISNGWTEAELEKLRREYPDRGKSEIAADLGRSASAVKQKARKLGIYKSEAFMAKGPGQIRPGATPWNKGLSYPARGRAAETQFKPGHKPWTWLPVGSEIEDGDGILRRKVSDTGHQRSDWQPVHVLIWEERFGPVPESHLVVFSDGNRRNFDQANLECISRAENMRRNSHYNRSPREVSLAIQAMGALNRQIRKRRQAQ